MSKCLNCSKELIHIEGKKPKVYCSNNCRQAYWQKKKPKILKTKVLSMAEWEEIQKKLNSMESKEIKIQDATKPTNVIKPSEQQKTNFAINTTRHKKYKEGDPPEGSNAFFIRYGVFTYDEI